MIKVIKANPIRGVNAVLISKQWEIHAILSAHLRVAFNSFRERY